MIRSDRRILTTHAGSLPRPKRLAEMLVRGSRGEIVEHASLAREIAAATSGVIKRQLETGIDIGNNGEQGRERVFTYVRDRMTGFAAAVSARLCGIDFIMRASAIWRRPHSSPRW
ncbi:MAG: hypothetical protein ACREP6_15485 [Candidatus Binataceae bacterium]